MNTRLFLQPDKEGFSIGLLHNSRRVGRALVSCDAETGTVNLDYVAVQPLGRGLGHVLMAAWLVEAERRNSTMATADFLNEGALRAFKHAVGGLMPTHLFIGGVEEEHLFNSYKDAEAMLRQTQETGVFSVCPSVSCEIKFPNAEIVEAARIAITAAGVQL